MVKSTCTFPSDLGQLAAMREFLDGICRRAWSVEADDDELSQLELAMQEAATNIIRHAYEGRPGLPIHMTVEADDAMARVSLAHHGRDFDPNAAPAPSFDGSRFGGFGLYFIDRLADEVTYIREEDGRCGIRLLKRRTPRRVEKSPDPV